MFYFCVANGNDEFSIVLLFVYYKKLKQNWSEQVITGSSSSRMHPVAKNWKGYRV